jgi:hypothetical protein
MTMNKKSKRGNFLTEWALVVVLIAVTFAAIHPAVGKIMKGQVGNVANGYAGITNGVVIGTTGAGAKGVTLGPARTWENPYQIERSDNYQEQVQIEQVANKNLSIRSSSLSARAAGSETIETGVKNRGNVEDLWKP